MAENDAGVFEGSGADICDDNRSVRSVTAVAGPNTRQVDEVLLGNWNTWKVVCSVMMRKWKLVPKMGQMRLVFGDFIEN